MEIPPGKEVECLMDEIKRQLQPSPGSQTKAYAAARRQAMMQHVPDGTKVSEELLQATGACSGTTSSSCPLWISFSELFSF